MYKIEMAYIAIFGIATYHVAPYKSNPPVREYISSQLT